MDKKRTTSIRLLLHKVKIQNLNFNLCARIKSQEIFSSITYLLTSVSAFLMFLEFSLSTPNVLIQNYKAHKKGVQELSNVHFLSLENQFLNKISFLLIPLNMRKYEKLSH
jgi:hypothetical protein